MITRDSLGSGYKLVGFVPIRQQVRGLFIVNADVVILEDTGEEVVDLPRYVQDELNPEWRRESAGSLRTEAENKLKTFIDLRADDTVPSGSPCFLTRCSAAPPCWMHSTQIPVGNKSKLQTSAEPRAEPLKSKQPLSQILAFHPVSHVTHAHSAEQTKGEENHLRIKYLNRFLKQ